jgi:tRNA 2-thiouridine synthesizing protein D
MIISLLVTSPPTATLAIQQAVKFVQVSIDSGNVIDNIFFYMDGVNNANAYLHPMNDEFNAHKAWQVLSNKLNIPLLVCKTAAERRGVIDETLALALNYSNANLGSPFQSVGLSEFFERLHNIDRLVQF